MAFPTAANLLCQTTRALLEELVPSDESTTAYGYPGSTVNDVLVQRPFGTFEENPPLAYTDCSGFICEMLTLAGDENPVFNRAFQAIAAVAEPSRKPYTRAFVFQGVFQCLAMPDPEAALEARGVNDPGMIGDILAYWEPVTDITQIQGGDLIAWSLNDAINAPLQEDYVEKGDTGHILIVADPPSACSNVGDGTIVPVFDASSSHLCESQDYGRQVCGLEINGKRTGVGWSCVAFLPESGPPSQFRFGEVWHPTATESVAISIGRVKA